MAAERVGIVPARVAVGVQNDLSSEIMQALLYYKEDGYDRINKSLREAREFADIEEKTKEIIVNIDKALKKGNSEVRLYRGVYGIDEFLQLSNVLVHKNFCSSSTDIEVAKRFSGGGCCILTFLLPSYIRRYQFGDEHEKEVLLDRSLQFTIDPNYRIIDGVKVFDSIVSAYEPPKIDKELVKRSMTELDALMVGESWKNQLPERFSQADVDELIEKKKALNFAPEVYKMIRAMLVFYAKTQ